MTDWIATGVCRLCGRMRVQRELDDRGECREGHWIDSANDEAWCGQG